MAGPSLTMIIERINCDAIPISASCILTGSQTMEEELKMIVPISVCCLKSRIRATTIAGRNQARSHDQIDHVISDGVTFSILWWNDPELLLEHNMSETIP